MTILQWDSPQNAAVAMAAGVVGPALIGAVKDASGGYAVPMLILTAISALAVAYFAVLLRFLPIKRSSALRPNQPRFCAP